MKSKQQRNGRLISLETVSDDSQPIGRSLMSPDYVKDQKICLWSKEFEDYLNEMNNELRGSVKSMNISTPNSYDAVKSLLSPFSQGIKLESLSIEKYPKNAELVRYEEEDLDHKKKYIEDILEKTQQELTKLNITRNEMNLERDRLDKQYSEMINMRKKYHSLIEENSQLKTKLKVFQKLKISDDILLDREQGLLDKERIIEKEYKMILEAKETKRKANNLVTLCKDEIKSAIETKTEAKKLIQQLVIMKRDLKAKENDLSKKTRIVEEKETKYFDLVSKKKNLKEVETKLRSKEVQLNKNYLQFQNEKRSLKNLEFALNKRKEHLDQKENKITKLELEIQRLKSIETTLLTEISTLTKRNEKLQDKLQEVKKNNNLEISERLQYIENNLKKRISKLKSQVKADNETEKVLAEQILKLKNQNKALNSTRKRLESDINNMKQQHVNLTTQLEESRSLQSRQRLKMEEFTRRIKILESRVQSNANRIQRNVSVMTSPDSLRFPEKLENVQNKRLHKILETPKKDLKILNLLESTQTPPLLSQFQEQSPLEPAQQKPVTEKTLAKSVNNQNETLEGFQKSPSQEMSVSYDLKTLQLRYTALSDELQKLIQFRVSIKNRVDRLNTLIKDYDTATVESITNIYRQLNESISRSEFKNELASNLLSEVSKLLSNADVTGLDRSRKLSELNSHLMVFQSSIETAKESYMAMEEELQVQMKNVHDEIVKDTPPKLKATAVSNRKQLNLKQEKEINSTVTLSGVHDLQRKESSTVSMNTLSRERIDSSIRQFEQLIRQREKLVDDLSLTNSDAKSSNLSLGDNTKEFIQTPKSKKPSVANFNQSDKLGSPLLSEFKTKGKHETNVLDGNDSVHDVESKSKLTLELQKLSLDLALEEDELIKHQLEMKIDELRKKLTD